MALGRRHDYAPFGWSVAYPGRKPGQVREDVRGMVRWAKDTWGSYFPPERGYRIEVESPAGTSNGVQLSVSRGDFRASLAVESILDPHRKMPGDRAVRVFGRARSGALADAEQAIVKHVQRFRVAGGVVGLSLLAMFCWLSIGVHDPIFVLGGLLMVVAGLFMTTALAAFGAWLGECVGESGRCRALADVAKDDGLQDDLRRWRALVRQMAARRHALEGSSNDAPFRALPEPTSDPSGSYPVPVRRTYKVAG